MAIPQLNISSELVEILNKDEVDTLDYLSNVVLDSLSLPTIAVFTADEIFGQKMDSKDENLFLHAVIDETQPLQSELVAKINAMFEDQNFHDPDRLIFQVFKRTAGYAPNNDEPLLGQYCMALCLKDFQIVSFNKKEHLLSQGMASPLFELESGKKKPRPFVPRNRTKVSLGKGQGTIKSRKYLSFLIWAFWDGYPIKEKSKQNSEELQKVLDNLKEKESQAIEIIPQSDYQVIYDPKIEATIKLDANGESLLEKQ